MADRLVINVEAQVARGMFDEADVLEALGREALELARAAAEESTAATDELVALEKRDEARSLNATAQAHLRNAAAARKAGRAAVVAAQSLPDDTAPEALEPTRREPLTADEETGRAADSLAAAWQDFRAEREARLRAVDWTQTADIPTAYTAEFVAAMATYRQALRDLPATTTDPRSPVWPKPPAAPQPRTR